jgi:BlaI family transcriptional regulator, penicillinase repressor
MLMARPTSKYPTELELEILKVLWRIGPAAGREIRDALAATRDLAYTSVMTMLNIMTRKKYLKRCKVKGGFIYEARVSEQSTSGRMVRDLVDRAFAGSPSALMLSLLETGDIDAEEIQRLRELINRKAKEPS